MGWTSVALSDVRAIKKSFDVKVNDVVLEIVGSILRAYLHDRGELPDMPLAACVPVSLFLVSRSKTKSFSCFRTPRCHSTRP